MSVLPQEDLYRVVSQLQRHEGTKRSKDGKHIAYRCPAGALTIGYGHNLDARPIPSLNAASKLTEAEAKRLLLDDIADIERELLAVAAWWVRDLQPVRLAVLINMAFNLGVPGLLKFKVSLNELSTGNYAGAARQMLASRWAGQVGYRAHELSLQMMSGKWA